MRQSWRRTEIWDEVDENDENDEDDEEDFYKSIWIVTKELLKHEICEDIASFRMMKERFLLQIFEHACDVH